MENTINRRRPLYIWRVAEKNYEERRSGSR